MRNDFEQGNLWTVAYERLRKATMQTIWALNAVVQLFGFALIGLAATSAIAEERLPNESEIYTLYRSSVAIENTRYHVATFDAVYGHKYNFGNCQIAADLFEQQPGVRVEYWCERGRFRE